MIDTLIPAAAASLARTVLPDMRAGALNFVEAGSSSLEYLIVGLAVLSAAFFLVHRILASLPVKKSNVPGAGCGSPTGCSGCQGCPRNARCPDEKSH
jgi:hypothetical protein